jgi:hypothetical protein
MSKKKITYPYFYDLVIEDYILPKKKKKKSKKKKKK